MAHIKLNTIQIVLMAQYYEKLLRQIIHMAHICENDMIQIRDMLQIVAPWLQFSTEEYLMEIPPLFVTYLSRQMKRQKKKSQKAYKLLQSAVSQSKWQ